MKLTQRFFGAALLLFCTISPAQAWFDVGHMEVAAVAWKHMNASTKARAIQLLKLNPYYDKWLQAVPSGAGDDTRDQYIFMQAATWPDAIKEDPTYISDGANNGHAPDGRIATQNIGYADHNLHKYWHFTDQGFSRDGTALPPPAATNAESEIVTLRQAIASNANDDIKSYDLTWLMHLVGDVHQPLHCGTRVSKDAPTGDAGGNNVKLDCPDCPTNLHAFWDGLPGFDRSPDTALRGMQQLKSAPNKLAQDLTTGHWCDESFRLAKKSVYVSPIAPGFGPFAIDRGFAQRAKRIAAQRVELAGERLAGVLNNEMKYLGSLQLP